MEDQDIVINDKWQMVLHPMVYCICVAAYDT